MEGRRITKLQSCIFGGGFGGGGQTAAVAATEREQGRGSERLFETVENVDLSVFLLLPPTALGLSVLSSAPRARQCPPAPHLAILTRA